MDFALPAAGQSRTLAVVGAENSSNSGTGINSFEGDLEQKSQLCEQPLGVAIIDDRTLLRDCFGRSLAATDPRLDLIYFSDVDSFEVAPQEIKERVRVVVMWFNWSKERTEALLSAVSRLRAAEDPAQIVVVSAIDDLDDILAMIENGVRGYIPISDRLEVAAKAIQLVAAGGIYVPSDLLFWSGRVIKEMSRGPKSQANSEDTFTSRQMAVIEALRRGKANKVIAYELNMCESTVKVHIRNVMKKLNARNRTELAFIFNNRMRQHSRPAGSDPQ